MGLGKTLSMIALVASDKDSEFQMEQDIHDAGQSSGSCTQSTLIVVPSPCEFLFLLSTEFTFSDFNSASGMVLPA